MFVQPQKDNGTTCQSRFQVKYIKECSRTDSINYISRITNRFSINETSCSQRKEEKCYQRNKKLFKARLLLPKKTCGLKGKLIALNESVIPFRLYTRRTNKFHSHCLTLANGDWDQSFPFCKRSS
ncbi:hypothetical protein ACTFIZ_007908 [Dictyostelium cf. discoideum]